MERERERNMCRSKKYNREIERDGDVEALKEKGRISTLAYHGQCSQEVGRFKRYDHKGGRKAPYLQATSES